jgi:hypothetical protein
VNGPHENYISNADFYRPYESAGVYVPPTTACPGPAFAVFGTGLSSLPPAKASKNQRPSIKRRFRLRARMPKPKFD